MRHLTGRLAFASAALCATLAFATPSHAAAAPDAWVTTKVKMALLTTDGVSGTRVSVDTIDGRVTLHGTVRTPAEKAKAEQVAKSIDGAREVRNLLQVVPAAAEKRAEVSDDQLKKSVSDALKGDPSLADSSIEVASVNSGVVLLDGTARTLSDHRHALEVASGVPGVRRVASEIKSPETMSDAEIWREGKYDAAAYDKSTARDVWITTDAKLRLLASTKVPGFDVNVDTENGVVTLFGMVDSEQAKRAAETEVRKVDGVRNVKNALQVVAKRDQDVVKASDGDLKTAIEQRLEPRGNLSDIDVDVKNGVARLTGEVKSQSDRIEALTIARSTAGVRGLIDDLHLETPTVSAR